MGGEVKDASALDDLVKMRTVCAAIGEGTKPRTVKHLTDTQNFPRPIQLSPRMRRWKLSEVKAWIDTRPRGWHRDVSGVAPEDGNDRGYADASVAGDEVQGAA